MTNPEYTAFDAGRDAFLADKTVRDNPFRDEPARSEWFKGRQFESDMMREFEAAIRS